MKPGENRKNTTKVETFTVDHCSIPFRKDVTGSGNCSKCITTSVVIQLQELLLG